MIKACLKLYSKDNETVEFLWFNGKNKQFHQDLYDLVLNLTEKTVIKNNLFPFIGSDQNNYLTLSNYLKTNFPSVNFSYYENNTSLSDSEYESVNSTFPIIRKV